MGTIAAALDTGDLIDGAPEMREMPMEQEMPSEMPMQPQMPMEGEMPPEMPPEGMI